MRPSAPGWITAFVFKHLFLIAWFIVVSYLFGPGFGCLTGFILAVIFEGTQDPPPWTAKGKAYWSQWNKPQKP